MDNELSGQELEEDERRERQQKARQASVDHEFLRAMQEKIIKEKTPPRKFPKKLPLPPPPPESESEEEKEEEEEKSHRKKRKGELAPPKKKPCSCKRVFSLFDIILWVFAFWGSYSAGKTIFEFVSSFLQKTPGEISNASSG